MDIAQSNRDKQVQTLMGVLVVLTRPFLAIQSITVQLTVLWGPSEILFAGLFYI